MNGGRDHEASAKRNQIINADCVRRIAQHNLNPAMTIINLYFVPKLDYPQAVKVDVERDTFSKSRLTFCKTNVKRLGLVSEIFIAYLVDL